MLLLPIPPPSKKLFCFFNTHCCGPECLSVMIIIGPGKEGGRLFVKELQHSHGIFLSNTEVETDKSMPKLKMQDFVFKCVIVLD